MSAVFVLQEGVSLAGSLLPTLPLVVPAVFTCPQAPSHHHPKPALSVLVNSVVLTLGRFISLSSSHPLVLFPPSLFSLPPTLLSSFCLFFSHPPSRVFSPLSLLFSLLLVSTARHSFHQFLLFTTRIQSSSLFLKLIRPVF